MAAAGPPLAQSTWTAASKNGKALCSVHDGDGGDFTSTHNLPPRLHLQEMRAVH